MAEFLEREKVPRLKWDSPEAEEYIRQGIPVILLDCPLAAPVANRWNFDFLSKAIIPDFKCDVFKSKSCRFTYWNNSDKTQNGYAFEVPFERVGMSFRDFSKRLQSLKNPEAPNHAERTKLYLQTSVVMEMGPKMMEEYRKFSLEAALKFKLLGEWDAFSTNLLLAGPKGAITPCHYDEQQNLFAQLWGEKRIRLFSPLAWKRLYPYPYHHPMDRQTRVTLPEEPGSTELEDSQDRIRFPEFSNCEDDTAEITVVLGPGEVLYVPQYWFHQMEAMTDNVSLSWWFKDQKKTARSNAINVSSVSLVAVRRNLEKLIASFVGDGKQAHKFFLCMASRKLNIPDAIPVAPTDTFSLPETDPNSPYDLIEPAPNMQKYSNGADGKSRVVAAPAKGRPAPGPSPSAPSSSSKQRGIVEASSSGSSSGTISGSFRANTNARTTAPYSASPPAARPSSQARVSSSSSSLSMTQKLSASSGQSDEPPPAITEINKIDFDEPERGPLAFDVMHTINHNLEVPAGWDSIMSQIVQMCSLIIKPEGVKAFLQQLVSGRFSDLHFTEE